MDCKEEKQLIITLKDKEIETFKSIITKCKDENNRIGFNNNKFTKDENNLLYEIDKGSTPTIK